MSSNLKWYEFLGISFESMVGQPMFYLYLALLTLIALFWLFKLLSPIFGLRKVCNLYKPIWLSVKDQNDNNQGYLCSVQNKSMLVYCKEDYPLGSKVHITIKSAKGSGQPYQLLTTVSSCKLIGNLEYKFQLKLKLTKVTSSQQVEKFLGLIY